MKNITAVLSIITIVIVTVFLLAFPTMWLWNYIMPTVFNLPEISFWQTLALLILSEIFFKKNNNK